MPSAATFESFEKELGRLVAKFERGFAEFQNPGYLEAQLRDDFLSPFFAALGWDLQNNAGLIQSHREVEIESRTGSGRADYLFRPERKSHFVCEAKKPAEELHGGYAMQAKRYAWTIGVRLAVLSDFEELKIYIVTGNPDKGEPDDGLWRSYHYTEYVAKARELWDLLARDNVAGGSIERALESLPKKLRPNRTKDFDEEFLAFLDGHRRALASDLIRHNDRADLLEGTKLNEAVQCILDRLLFIRISEARGIDMGTKLHSLLETWSARQEKSDRLREEPPANWGGSGLGASKGTLWNSIVRHIRALDRRPPSHVPFFNGNLFKHHFSEELIVGDVWLSEFLFSISDEESSYKFGYVAVEILGTIYERFLGKIVRPHGRGAVIEEKPEVRKAGGVYYTPRYIVEYIVEQTVGKMLDGKKPEETLKLRFLDPACGSGSFLLRVFERVCEHWLQWLADNPGKRKKDWCWLDAKTNTLHLTVRTKRRILRETVYGVDLDPQAVEVTQLSLYLKMMEGETAETLQREQDLFGGDEAILPPLQDNIKCGNSLIASDFSVIPDDLVRVHAFDWPVQFESIIKKAGGFDAVIGNPPYGADSGEDTLTYLREKYEVAGREVDTYALFMEQGVKLVRPGGFVSMIVPTGWYSGAKFPALRRFTACKTDPTVFVNLPYDVFADAWVDTTVYAVTKRKEPSAWPRADKQLVALKTFPKRHKIQTSSEFGQNMQATEFAEWFAEGGDIFLTYADSKVTSLIRRLERNGVPFSSYADIQRGVTPFNLTEKPTHKTSLRAFEGTVRRYTLDEGPERYVRFDGTLAEPKPIRYFQGSRLLIRELISRQFQIQAVKVTKDFVTNKSMQSALPLPGGPDVNFLLGCFNSRLLSWFFLQKSNIAQRDDFPKIVLKETRSLPFPKIDLKNRADKTRHDKLVVLVDKMLGLMPKLRAATAESAKATLQNAVTKTEQDIDALVYELYGLTKEEIKLVEAGEK